MPPKLRSENRRHDKALEFSLTADPQSQSILFRMPAEITNLIFEYTMVASEDPSRPHRPAYCPWRPGYSFHQTIAIALLRTCKLAYIAAYRYPVWVNEHTLWMTKYTPEHYLPIQRAAIATASTKSQVSNEAFSEVKAEVHETEPEDFEYPEPAEESDDDYKQRGMKKVTPDSFRDIEIYALRMLPEQRRDMINLQFFITRSVLNDRWDGSWSLPYLLPMKFLRSIPVKFLTLTIPAEGWTRFSAFEQFRTERESDRMALDPRVARHKTFRKTHMEVIHHGEKMTGSDHRAQPVEPNSLASDLATLLNLEIFTLELETERYLKEHLDSVVSHAHNWVFTLRNGRVMRLDSSNIETVDWYAGRGRRLVVKKLKWKVESKSRKRDSFESIGASKEEDSSPKRPRRLPRMLSSLE